MQAAWTNSAVWSNRTSFLRPSSLPEDGLRIYSADLPLDEQETEGEQPADLQNHTRFVDRVGVDRLFCRCLDGVRIS